MSDTGKPRETKLTPMLRQFQEVKEAHPDKLILFRMGDFYETFFDDAYLTSKTLGITLTTRDKNSADPVPLAGFPYHALDQYLDKLIKAGFKVAICEQIGEATKGRGLVDRDVTRVITPGTVVDPSMLDAQTMTLMELDASKRYGLVPEGGLQQIQGDDRTSLTGAQWLRLQQAIAPAAPFVATLRACAEVLPELKAQLRGLLNYHCGVGTLRTRQMMIDLQTL